MNHLSLRNTAVNPGSSQTATEAAAQQRQGVTELHPSQVPTPSTPQASPIRHPLAAAVALPGAVLPPELQEHATAEKQLTQGQMDTLLHQWNTVSGQARTPDTLLTQEYFTTLHKYEHAFSASPKVRFGLYRLLLQSARNLKPQGLISFLSILSATGTILRHESRNMKADRGQRSPELMAADEKRFAYATSVFFESAARGGYAMFIAILDELRTAGQTEADSRFASAYAKSIDAFAEVLTTINKRFDGEAAAAKRQFWRGDVNDRDYRLFAALPAMVLASRLPHIAASADAKTGLEVFDRPENAELQGKIKALVTNLDTDAVAQLAETLLHALETDGWHNDSSLSNLARNVIAMAQVGQGAALPLVMKQAWQKVVPRS